MNTEARGAIPFGAKEPPKRPFTSYTLRTKLIVAFLIVALIPLALLSYLNYRASRAALTRAASQAIFAAASQTAANFDNFFNSNLEAVNAEAQLPALAEYLDLPAEQRLAGAKEAEVVAILRTASRRNSTNISSYALLDRQGQNVVDSFAPDIGSDEHNYDYFQVPLESGEPYASPVILGELPNQAYIYLSSPVRNASGEIVGVLRASYNASVLQRLLIQSNGLVGPDSYGVLFDENHIHLAHGTAPEKISKAVAPLDPARIAELQAAQRLPYPLPAEFSTELPDLDQKLANAVNQPYFATQDVAVASRLDQAAVTTMKTQPWLVAFLQPQDVFLAPVRIQSRNEMLLVALIAGVVVAAAIGVGRLLTSPITRLTAVAEQIIAGDLTAQARVESGDEIGVLASTFNSMTAQLRDLITGLERQVVERTRQWQDANYRLQRRAIQLEAIALVGHAITSILNLDELLLEVVNLIRTRFDFYHAGIFLVDEGREWAVLRQASGEAGQRMLARKHRLAVGGQSIVGWVTGHRQPRVALDVGADAVHFKNPDLPHTRSEMALPLIVGDRLLGALDVQSMEEAAFDEEDVAILRLMADQVAVAIDNAFRFSEESAVLEATSPLYRASRGIALATSLDDVLSSIVEHAAGPHIARCTLDLYADSSQGQEAGWLEVTAVWDRAHDAPNPPGTRYPLSQFKLMARLRQEAAEPLVANDLYAESLDGRVDNGTLLLLTQKLGLRAVLILPLVAAGRPTGLLMVTSRQSHTWTETELRTFRSLSAQVAGAVENARLFQRAQARAERERLVAEITDQIRTSPQVDSILRTAIGELGRALRASEGWIRLDVAEESGSPEPPAQPPSWGQN